MYSSTGSHRACTKASTSSAGRRTGEVLQWPADGESERAFTRVRPRGSPRAGWIGRLTLEARVPTEGQLASGKTPNWAAVQPMQFHKHGFLSGFQSQPITATAKDATMEEEPEEEMTAEDELLNEDPFVGVDLDTLMRDAEGYGFLGYLDILTQPERAAAEAQPAPAVGPPVVQPNGGASGSLTFVAPRAVDPHAMWEKAMLDARIRELKATKLVDFMQPNNVLIQDSESEDDNPKDKTSYPMLCMTDLRYAGWHHGAMRKATVRVRWANQRHTWTSLAAYMKGTTVEQFEARVAEMRAIAAQMRPRAPGSDSGSILGYPTRDTPRTKIGVMHHQQMRPK